ncbi:endonuclease V [Rugosimonospora acidiphila]|uniref:Endonuclease V n=1 Tax=Rugosimonospora acidiphila TaxID=556531 RepID=A0ABP9STB8_9ACTN
MDVQYTPDGGALAAAVLAQDTRFAAIVAEHTARLAEVAAYRPGHFYARELPALDAVLAKAGAIDLLIVDGYVDLSPDGRPGLGAHAHARFGVPVIGVAKTAFQGATHAIAVVRGEAIRPLYVTAAGLDRGEAAEFVREMAGPYRMPDALRRVDRLARTGA